MRMGWGRVAALSATVAWAAGGCGSSSGTADNAGFGIPSAAGDDASASFTGPGVGGGGGFGSDGGGVASLPAEMKKEGNFQSPVATGKIVWIANPTSGRVAFIDATSFNVQTVEAGNGPTFLAAVPDPVAHDDVAIVLNVRSQDATLLRDHAGGLSTKTFASTVDANSWAVAASGAASGRWAIAWTDATQVSNPDPLEGFHDIAVMDLSAGTSTPLAVGYRPTQLGFSGDGTHAFAVTEDGISVIDLTGAQPKVTQNFPLTASIPVAPPAGDGSAEASAPDGGTAVPPGNMVRPDVSLTPDYALVRIDGQTAITIVSLKDGTTTSVVMPTAPTDLTLSPAGDFAMAVLRDISSVAVLPLPGIVSDPTSFTTLAVPGEIVGRAIVTKSGKTALLFTTAAPIERLTVLTLQPPSLHTIGLHAAVGAVFPTDDGQNAIVLHPTPPPGSTVKGAFSIVPIGSNLPPKIEPLPAPPIAVALSPASDRALVSVRDDTASIFDLYVAMMPSLEVVPYTLASPPIAVGIAAGAARGYAAQDYAQGRITFVDLASSACEGGTTCNAARTITGFELGARIVNGSGP